MTDKAIRLQNIDLSLGRGAARVHILKGISLEIGRGEAVGLVGPSGSGKSTLLMTMAGVGRPGSGKVIVDGTDPSGPDEDAFARAAAELELVGLAERMQHYPAQLSGGEQQRVAIARAIVPNPAILVADEPTGNLDENTGGSIIDLLFALKRDRGATLVLVTHDLNLARLCDRTVRLRSGQVEAGAASAVA